MKILPKFECRTWESRLFWEICDILCIGMKISAKKNVLINIPVVQILTFYCFGFLFFFFLVCICVTEPFSLAQCTQCFCFYCSNIKCLYECFLASHVIIRIPVFDFFSSSYPYYRWICVENLCIPRGLVLIFNKIMLE